jgi:hypothetical protein
MRVVVIGGGVVVNVAVVVMGMVVDMVVGMMVVMLLLMVVNTVVGTDVNEVTVEVKEMREVTVEVVMFRDTSVVVTVLFPGRVNVDVSENVILLVTVTVDVVVTCDVGAMTVVFAGGAMVTTGTVTGMVTVDVADTVTASAFVVSVTVTVATVSFHSGTGNGGLLAATQYDWRSGRLVHWRPTDGFYFCQSTLNSLEICTYPFVEVDEGYLQLLFDPLARPVSIRVVQPPHAVLRRVWFVIVLRDPKQLRPWEITPRAYTVPQTQEQQHQDRNAQHLG